MSSILFKIKLGYEAIKKVGYPSVFLQLSVDLHDTINLLPKDFTKIYFCVYNKRYQESDSINNFNKNEHINMYEYLRYITGENAPTEPVSLYIGTFNPEDYGKPMENISFNLKAKKVIDALAKNGIKAFSYENPKSALYLSSVVVTKTGIRTPVIPPSQVVPVAKRLLSILQDNDIEIFGFVNPVSPEQMNPRTAKYMQRKRVLSSSFIRGFLDTVSSHQDSYQSFTEIAQSFPDDKRFLYKGKNTYSETNSYITLDYSESSSLIYATSKLDIAVRYLKALPLSDSYDRFYSFLSIYERNNREVFYGVGEIQNFGSAKENPNESCQEEHETPVRKNNKLYASFLVIQKNYLTSLFQSNTFANEDTLFIRIPEPEQRSYSWKRFLSLHVPSPTELYSLNEKGEKIKLSAINPLYREDDTGNYKYLAARIIAQKIKYREK